MIETKPLSKGQRLSFFDYLPDEIWQVTSVTECAAVVERELKAPKLVEIKDHDGAVLRSFWAKTSGDKMQISPRSLVVLLPVVSAG